MTSQNKTYYEILGVSEDASFEEIRAAFRERAREYHPDRNRSPDAVERMQEINEAYEVLRDEQERAAYDRAHRAFAPSDAENRQSQEVAIGVLGEFAFQFGYNIGARVRDEWTARIRRLEDTPAGLWQAAYAAALEIALEHGERSEAHVAALVAAWRAANNETAARAYRHALWERAPSLGEAIVTDFSTQLVGMLAATAGNQRGQRRILEQPSNQAWIEVSDAVKQEVWAVLAAWSGRLSMSLLQDARFAEMIMDRAISRGVAVLSEHIPSIEHGSGRTSASQRRPSGMSQGSRGGEGAMGCGLLMILVGGLITLGTFLAAGPGASFYIFGGAVLFGGISFIRGWLASGDGCKIAGAAILAIMLVVGYVLGDITGFNQAMS